MIKITKIQHSCFLIEANSKRIVTDPFSLNIKEALIKHPNLKNPDFVLISHGHNDHFANLFDIVGDQTQIVSNFEIVNFLLKKGFKNVCDMNTGGTIKFDKLSITMTYAQHSSSIEDSGCIVYAGLACGYIISFEETNIYFAGDTSIFSDMRLIQELYHPQIGLIPIGGRFTMDIEQALYACNKLFRFDIVVPMHYNTFPPISVDLKKFTDNISNSKVLVLDDLETIEV